MTQKNFIAAGFAIVGVLFSLSAAQADVLVYKKSCGNDAKENWNLTCKIDRNTYNNTDRDKDFWADPFRDLQSITICASFHNRGGLNVPSTIVYNYKDDPQSQPTDLFDTVKFQGNLVAEKMSWVGTSPRLTSDWTPAWRMQGELFRNSRPNSFTYAETLSNGQRLVGEIRATCSYLDDR